MFETYEDCLSEIEKFAVRDGYGEFRLAREEFHNNTGVFEDGEPWFETRMKMFMDWYLLERISLVGMTPLAAYLTEHGRDIAPEHFRRMEALSASFRSVFRILKVAGNTLILDDLASGGRWEAEGTTPTKGLEKDDIIDARIAEFGGCLILCPAVVLHQKEAREDIYSIVARAKAEKMPARELVDHLDKMRLKLDRYSNVRIQHIYRYPGDTRL